MKKLLLFSVLFIFLFSFNFAQNKNDNATLTKKNIATFDTTAFTVIWSYTGDNAPEWFTDGSEAETGGSPAFAGVERGIVYSPLTGHIYVSSRAAEDTDGDDVIDTPEPHVFVLDAITGQAPVFGIDRLITDGIKSTDQDYGGGYCLNNVTVSEDGSIFASNMTLASGPDIVGNDGAVTVKAFRVYRWSWEQDLPQMIINYTEGGYRLGDKFSVIGNWDDQAYIYAVPGENTKMLRWNVSGGIVSETPETISLQDITTVGTSGTVAPVPGKDDWVYVSGKGFMPTLFSIDGVNLSQVAITTSELTSSVLAGRTILFNNKIYMAMFSGDQRAFVFEATKHGENITDADVIGLTPTFGTRFVNAYGEGAVEFGVINDSLNVFACGPSNGIARFRIEGIYTSVQRLETKEFDLSVYPNPAKDFTTVRFTLPDNANGVVAVKLYDLNGKFIRIIAGEAIGGQQEINVNLSDLQGGLYTYTIVYKNKIAYGKLSVQ